MSANIDDEGSDLPASISSAYNRVWEEIYHAKSDKSIGERQFVPKITFDKVTQKEIIMEVVREDASLDSLSLSTGDKDAFAEKIFRQGRKLFATCVYSGLSMKCLRIILNKYSDESLPLQDKDLPKDFEFTDKKQYKIAFLPNQSLFLVVTLELGKSENFTPNEVIPIDRGETLCGKGAFGSVYPIEIHPDQHKFHPVKNKFAMKIFSDRAVVGNATSSASFQREQNIGSAGLVHEHLVKMLMSFTYRGDYYMIFDLAEHNLLDHIEYQTPPLYSNPKERLWFTTQVTGLAEALEVIHVPGKARYGHLDPQAAADLQVADSSAYHHDIKHDNILCFEGVDNHIVLRLSDFGCGKIAKLLLNSTGKKQSHRTPTKGGLTFEAPEAFSGPTSRPYDVWSLACVFLEFFVWFVEGCKAVRAFQDSRDSRVSEDRPTVDDRFYYFKEGKKYLKEVVEEKIESLRASVKDDKILSDLLDVIAKLFVIEPADRPNATQLVRDLKPLKIRAESEPSPSAVSNALSNCRGQPTRALHSTGIPIPHLVTKSSTSSLVADTSTSGSSASSPISDIAKSFAIADHKESYSSSYDGDDYVLEVKIVGAEN